MVHHFIHLKNISMQNKDVHIQGFRNPDSNDIWVNGRKLDPAESIRLQDHSLDGFNWGYPGSGPAQAALGICLALTGDEDLALELHQPFKWSFVCRWPLDGNFDVTVDFDRFLADHPDAVQLAKEMKIARDLI